MRDIRSLARPCPIMFLYGIVLFVVQSCASSAYSVRSSLKFGDFECVMLCQSIGVTRGGSHVSGVKTRVYGHRRMVLVMRIIAVKALAAYMMVGTNVITSG